MTEISRDDLIPQLRRVFGFRGSENFELADFVIPTWGLEREEPPFHTKGGGVGGAAQGAVAAQVSYCALTFGAGTPSNCRAVVRMISLGAIGVAAPMQCFIGVTPNPAIAALGLADYGVPPDGSWDSGPSAVTATDRVIPSARTQVAASATSFFTANLGFIFWAPGLTANPGSALVGAPCQWVISPGSSLLVQGNTVNVGLSCGFYWDEFYVG